MTQDMPSYDLADQDADLVYSFVAAPNCIPGKSGNIFAARNSGLYRSADGGQTWQYALENLELTEPLPVTALAISPNFINDGIVIAGTSGGVFHSTDFGATWKAIIFPNPPPTISYIVFSPFFSADEVVFAGTMEDGVFVSQNGGSRWVAWNFGLLDLNVMSLAISPAFSTDETIFAGTETGIFRSTNGGRAWREVDLPFGFEAVLCLGISLVNKTEQRIFAGTEGQGLWLSHDSGVAWERLGEGLIEEPVNSIQLIGSEIFAFTSTAAWHSTDGGKTWKGHNLATVDEVSAALAVFTDQYERFVFIGRMDGKIHLLPL